VLDRSRGLITDRFSLSSKLEFIAFTTDEYFGPFVERSFQNLLGQWIFDVFLDNPS
jgi:hypothetical protein